jgi:VWFA-related protein
VLIVLSDGDDTSSRLPFDGVLDEVRRSGVMVYTISLRIGRRARPSAAPWPMTALATESGGRAVTIQNLSDLADTYHDIHGELANLYRIGYVPVPAPRDGGWRKISVRVPGTSFIARTRQGYYAPRPASGHKDKNHEERPR